MKPGKDFIGSGVGAVIMNERAEILLLKRKKAPEKGYWSIPGGTVEFGEKLNTAITREIEEELGVKVKVLCLLGVTDHIVEAENIHWISPVFLVKIIKGKPLNKEPHKHAEVKWFALNKLPKKITLTTKYAVKYYLDKQK